MNAGVPGVPILPNKIKTPQGIVKVRGILSNLGNIGTLGTLQGTAFMYRPQQYSLNSSNI
jgi:hypothetical protein